jgi:putative glutamine amidotransferase
MDSTPPPPDPAPVVGITCCRKVPEAFAFHSVGEKYLTAVTDAVGALPFLVPALGPRLDLDQVLAQLDGLVLTGSPSNIEPHHYAGGPEPEDNRTDPARDATNLPLIRRAVAAGVPVLGLCRGIQELNVAFGGTLHQELHRVDGRFDHRSDKSKAPLARYEPRHEVRLTPGGRLAGLFGADRITVNSLHGQGIERVADGLAVEAIAEDGTVEAVRVEGARRFALAVQWHPEYEPLTNRASTLLFRAFAEAARARARERRPLHVA